MGLTLRPHIGEHTIRYQKSMGSYSYSYTSSFSRSCSEDRSIRASSQMPEELLNSMQVDLPRFAREFYTPEPISVTGTELLETWRQELATCPTYVDLTTAIRSLADMDSLSISQLESCKQHLL